MKHYTRLTILSVFLLFGLAAPSYPATQKKGKTSTTQTRSTGKKNIGKKAPKKSSANSRKGKGSRSSTGKETSADLKKRQEQTQREIRQTKEQIQANEAAVKKNLGELNRLEGDIDQSRERVATAARQVQSTAKKIEGLESRIAKDEASLERLRAEYLKAVKKVRGKRKSTSMLAFLFSSGSFNQAVRRMRYLKQFSEWREKKSSELKAGVELLARQRDELSRTKNMHDQALRRETEARDALQQQFKRQDAIVVELRKNGDALRSHLANKQAEANALKNRVAAIIAEEQRRAEAERQAREAAERKAEAERRAREEAEMLARAEREAEAERAAQAQQQVKEETPKQQPERKRAENKAAKQGKDKTGKQTAKRSPKKKEVAAEVKPVKKEEVKQKSSSGGTDYAEARRRKPRGKTDSPAVASSGTAKGGGFENMRGSLPRPVGGAFRVTSRFGRHSLPDMPDVVFDNPGIDAEVAQGAAAQAVYPGKVSGVYMVPGFATVVIVSHGNYYTVYGNLSSTSVKVGDTVKQGQALGRVAPGEDDASHGSIHFEVWKNRDKQDPMLWIR